MQSKSTPASRVFMILFVGLSVGLLLNYQFLLDQYAIATFKPSSQMRMIEGEISLTDKARGIFYSAHPKIDDKPTFNRDCQTNKGELELGCYFQGKIFILNIANPSLESEVRVVSAHELLHAAWNRLSQSAKDKLTPLLEAAFVASKNPELVQRMDGYAKSEPGQRENELHSILATEKVSLPPDLEAYYGQYFLNRQSIVSAHTQYEAVFNSRRLELEGELTAIRNLKNQLSIVNSQLDAFKNQNKIEQYNFLVPRQNNLVDEINSKIVAYRTGVDEYNALSNSLDSQRITDAESNVQ